jgi:hypothetical protein
MKLSRRAVVAVVSVATTVAAVGAALAIGPQGPGDAVVAATAPATQLTATPSSSTVPTTNTASPTTTAQSTSTIPPETVSTTTTAMPRTMHIRGEHGTITLEVTLEPAYPRAGELVQFHVEATDTEGGIIVLGFDPGDRRFGSRPGPPSVDCVAPDPDAPPRDPAPAHYSYDFTYAYRLAETHRFNVMAASGDCFRDGHYADVTGTITVLAGVAASNGPRSPEAEIYQNPEGAPSSGVRLSVSAFDADGVVRHVMLDWGDGSANSAVDVPESNRACASEPTAYPSSGDTLTLDHVYSSPGTYTVTATVLSTGCDGGDGQSAVSTGTAVVEAAST